jgi:two-component system, NtrC family, sensor kinase
MDRTGDQDDRAAVIARLESKLKAREKTIEVLMNAAEQRFSAGPSSMELLSQNLNLERVVQHKTETLKRQGEQLQQALKELQLTQTRLLHAQKMESVGQLAAGVAHEINTPAQFISSNMEFLEGAFADVRRLVGILEKAVAAIASGTAIAETGREAADLLEELDWQYLDTEIPAAIGQSKEGLKRVTTIVQAMKEFSHPGSKVKGLFDLNRIIETTITVASNEWKYHAVIEKHLAADLPLVFCLADEMGQVFLNILINAAQAIADKNRGKTVKGIIAISTRREKKEVEICIADTGSGIAQHILPRIFDPFFTTKSVGEGTGQGLAITHDVIVKKHGGTIHCSSEVNTGTVFTLRLPIVPPNENHLTGVMADVLPDPLPPANQMEPK